MHTNFAAVVVVRNDEETGEQKFLVIDYRSRNPKTGVLTSIQTKFPGGGNDEYPEESVYETGIRELKEETGLVSQIQDLKLIWEMRASPSHDKYAFFLKLEACTGELRKGETFDGGDHLSEPYWATEKELAWIYQTHEPILKATLNELSSS